MTPQQAIKVIETGRPSDPRDSDKWDAAVETINRVVAKPTIKQMKCRCGSEHTQVLRAIKSGKTINTPSRALMTAAKTLRKWGCVKDGELTETGMQLCAMLGIS